MEASKYTPFGLGECIFLTFCRKYALGQKYLY